MFKKSLFMLVALAIAATAVMVPMASSAEGLSGSLCFNADFKDGSFEDSTGNYTLSESASAIDDNITIETDAELGRKVAVFDGWGPLVYNSASGDVANGYDLTKGITLEVYVYLKDITESHDTVFIETAGGSLHLQQYDSGDDHKVGFRCGDVPGAGEGGDGGDAGYKMRNAYRDGTLGNGKWVHIVGTSDGTVNQFYVDGVLAATTERAGSALRAANNSTSSDLYVGESYYGGMFSANAIEGKIAFARMYKAYASETDAKSLYEAAKGGSAPSDGGATGTPEGTPTGTPSGSSTDGPTGTATTTPNNNGSSNNSGKTPNTKTFDLGIVSLAAVALSSAVAIKKRK